MYITPIGQIGLVSNSYYKGDSAYRHTGLFKTLEEQTQYFDGRCRKYVKYQYNKDRNVFIIGDTVANISKYSYMWFNNGSMENTTFENKRYYAFITDIKYVNNSATEIRFDIDLIQTFMFDIIVPPCLVEREHTKTDNLYEHIIPEDFNVNDYVVSDEKEIVFPRMLCGIVLNKRLNDYEYTADGNTYTRKFTASFLPPYFNTTEVGVAGVPNTLYWYTGFPISDNDVTFFRNTSEYATQPLYETYTVEGETKYSYPSARWFTASYAINNIISGTYTGGGGALSEDNIVSVFIYPDFSSKYSAIDYASFAGYKKGIACEDYTVSRYSQFKYPSSSTPQRTYTPKNKKLYSYPYSMLECVNYQGQRNTYKFENFGGTIKFRLIGNYTNPAMLTLTPLNYSCDTFDYENSLNVSGMPEPYYSGDALNRYLQQNSNKRESALQASVLNGAVSALASAMSHNPLPLITGISNIVTTEWSQGAQISDLSNTPAQSYSVFNSDFLNVAINKVGFSIKQKLIRAEYAKVIDDYFTMFGYKINEIKKPNVFEYIEFGGLPDITKIRPAFNYLKTVNALPCNKSDTTMCDSSTLAQISRILNNGITFWVSKTKMGDYTEDNSPQ